MFSSIVSSSSAAPRQQQKHQRYHLSHNTDVFNSAIIAQQPHQQQASGKNLLSSIWDGETLPFRPPRPCMIYHIVQLPEFPSAKALNKLDSLHQQKKQSLSSALGRRNGNSNTSNDLLSSSHNRNHQQQQHSSSASAISSRSRAREASQQSTVSSTSMMMINTHNQASPHPRNQNKNDKKQSSRRNNANKDSIDHNDDHQQNHQNEQDGVLSSSSSAHKTLLQQQEKFPMYYPATRVCVPDKEGLYWDLDPSKIYYFEEVDSTSSTTSILLPEILPVLPRYDILNNKRNLDAAVKRVAGEENENENDVDSNNVVDDMTNAGGESLNRQPKVTTTTPVLTLDAAVQSNYWIEGESGKIAPTKVTLDNDTTANEEKNGSSSKSSKLTTTATRNRFLKNSANALGKKNLDSSTNILQQLSGRRRNRSITSSNEIIRILNDPDASYEKEQKKHQLSSYKSNDESFTVAATQGLSFLRHQLVQQQLRMIANSSNSDDPLITMSQVMNPSVMLSQQQVVLSQQATQNNRRSQASSLASQRQSVSQFLSQQGHSGAAREKDELVKKSVKDAMRFLPEEVQEELQKVLEATDHQWEEKRRK